MAKQSPRSANDSPVPRPPQLPLTAPKRKQATASSIADLQRQNAQTLEAWGGNDEENPNDESSAESVVDRVRDLLTDIERFCRHYKVFLAVMEEDPEPRPRKAKFRPKINKGFPVIEEKEIYGPIWTIDRNPEESYEDTKHRLHSMIKSLEAFPELRLAVCDMSGRLYCPPRHAGLTDSIANVKIVLSVIEDKTVFDGPMKLEEWARRFGIGKRGLTKRLDDYEEKHHERIRRMDGKLCLLRRDIVKEWSEKGRRETDRANRTKDRFSRQTNPR